MDENEESELSIYFPLNLHVCEIQIPEDDESEFRLKYQFSLLGISFDSPSVAWFADSQHAYWDQASRIFASGNGGPAVEFSVDVEEDADSVACTVRGLKFRMLQSTPEGHHGW